MMDIVIFLILMSICLGLIYIVHKYFGKEQLYLLAIVYSVVSFILSFKLVNIFGMNINANIIFTSGLLLILYYFVNRYSEKETRKFIYINIIVNLVCASFLIGTSVTVPSIYDKTSIFYQNIVLDNLAMIIVYPISFVITMFLSSYCFRELKKEDNKKIIKVILTIFGIMFIDVAIFIYFSYAFVLKYDTALKLLLDNYLIKVGIMIVYILIINKLFMIRKVK